MTKIHVIANCGDCRFCDHYTSMDGTYRCWHSKWGQINSREHYKTIGKEWKILPEWCPLEDFHIIPTSFTIQWEGRDLHPEFVLLEIKEHYPHFYGKIEFKQEESFSEICYEANSVIDLFRFQFWLNTILINHNKEIKLPPDKNGCLQKVLQLQEVYYTGIRETIRVAKKYTNIKDKLIDTIKVAAVILKLP